MIRVAIHGGRVVGATRARRVSCYFQAVGLHVRACAGVQCADVRRPFQSWRTIIVSHEQRIAGITFRGIIGCANWRRVTQRGCILET